jgi:hypothetical protein
MKKQSKISFGLFRALPSKTEYDLVMVLNSDAFAHGLSEHGE